MNAAGDIFVCEGHASSATAGARIIKLDKNGKFIKEWGKRGTGQGEFDQPHSFAFDSKGRLFIADRGNNRIQIYDQDGNFLEMGWQQYSRISGLWIDKDDMLFAADSESGGVARGRTNWKRGIRTAASDGATADPVFHPRPNEQNTGTSASGIAVDAAGNVYGLKSASALKKYVKK
jgi:sugar lactone lactonase YvrE